MRAQPVVPSQNRRIVAGLPFVEALARRLELTTDTAHAAGPRILAQRIDHRAANASLGEGLELDPTRIVKAMGRVDQSDHAFLDEIADIDRVRHRRGQSPRERFDKR